MCTRALELLTPVADDTYGRRGENEEAFPKQCKLPQDHYLLPEELDELGHAAGRVRDLQGTSGDSCDSIATNVGTPSPSTRVCLRLRQTFISGCMQRLIVVTLQVGQAVTSPFPVGGRTAFLSS